MKPNSRRNSGSNAFAMKPMIFAVACLFAETTFAQVLPTGGVVTAGNATIGASSGASLAIGQTSQRAIIDWTNFNIGNGASVTFSQPNTSAVAVNRVGINAGRSVIDGMLNANGHVMVLNPNGVLFGPTATVNVGGLVASTGNIDDAAFMRGDTRLSLSGPSSGASVVNQGMIRAAGGGLVALIAPSVSNSGVIEAQLGRVVLAGASKVTLDLYGDQLVQVAVDGGSRAGGVLVANSGRITADGGRVLLTAEAARGVMDEVINLSGIAQARGISVAGGVITLDGGSNGGVAVSGTLDVSATQLGGTGGSIKVVGGQVAIGSTARFSAAGDARGGLVETSGHRLSVAEGATVDTRAANGPSGTWLIDPATFNVAASGGDMTPGTLVTNLGTGDVVLQADQSITVTDAVNASANAVAHNLTLDALRVDLNAKITLKGAAILSGTASTVNVGANASIKNGFDVAAVNATVNVAAGTYNEHLDVTKTVTLLGAQHGVDAGTRTGSPGSESVLAWNGVGNGAFDIRADKVTIDGFTIQGTSGATAGIWANGFTHGGTVIQNNIIQNNSMGIYLQNDGTYQTVVRNNLFKDNTADGPAGQTAIYSDAGLRNSLIDGNTFTNNPNTAINLVNLSTAAGSGSANIISNNTMDSQIYLYGQVNGQVSGNLIANSSGGGIVLGGLNTALTISNNEVNGVAAGFGALRIRNDLGGPSANITLTNNKFNGGAGYGVRTSAGGYTGPLVLSGSQISGSAAAIQNDDASLLINASGNWWGTANPAAVPGMILGAGAANVDFTPMLVSGTDTSPARGFQGDFSSLIVHTLGAQTGTATRIQEGVNLVASGASPGQPGVVSVAPGNYVEGITNVDFFGAAGPSSFGLLLYKDNVLLQGVDALGAPITDFHNTQANITAQYQSGFGAQHFVSGNGVTVQGLTFKPVANGDNKTFELIGDNFTLRNSVIDNTGNTTPTALYMSQFDGVPRDVETFHIQNNRFVAGSVVGSLVIMASGMGNGGTDASNRVFSNNELVGTPGLALARGLRIRGQQPGVGELPFTAGPVTVAGNTFSNLDTPVNTIGFMTQDLDWSSILANNTFVGGAALAFAGSSTTARTTSVAAGTGLVPDIRITRDIPTSIGRASSGDTVRVVAGTYTIGSTIDVDKGISFLGPNAGIDGNSASRVAEAVITGSNASGPAFRIDTAAPVTFDGLKFNAGATQPIDSYFVGSNITLSNNVFSNLAAFLYFNSPATLTLKRNHFINVSDLNSSDSVVVAGNWNGSTGTAVTIQDNVFENPATVVSGLNLSNVSGLISGNTFRNLSYYGILLANNSSSLSVTNNLFDHITNPNPAVSTSWGAGIRFYTPAPTGPVAITGNEFSNSAIGVSVRSAPGSIPDLTGKDIRISGNSFHDNAQAIRNEGTGTLDASANWWGTTSASGIASLMTGAVDFSPYLVSGVDTTPASSGFQGNFGALNVTQLGAQAGTTGRIQEGVNLANAGGSVNVAAGTYAENVTVGAARNLALDGTVLHSLTLSAGAGGSGIGGSVTADTVSGFSFGAPVVLLSNTVLDASAAGGAVSAGAINGSVAGAQTLEIRAGSAAVSLGDLGSATRLGATTVTGSAISLTGATYAANSLLLGGVAMLTQSKTTVDTSAAGGAFTAGTINGSSAGAQALAVRVGTGAVSLGDIGATTRLGAIDVAGGAITLAGGTYAGNSLLLTGPATLTQALTTMDTSVAGGAVSTGAINGASAGAQALQVRAGSGAVTLADLGSGTRLGAASVTGGTIRLAGSTYAANSLQLTGPATLTQAQTTLDTSAANGAVTTGSINGSSAGAQALAVRAGSGAVLLGDLGAVTRLGAVTVAGAAINLAGSTYAANSLLLGAPASLTQALTTLDTSATGGTLTTGAINGSSAGAQALRIRAGAGTVGVADLGSSIRLGTTDVAGGTINLGGSNYAADSLLFTGPVTLAQAQTTFKTVGGDITFNGDIQNAGVSPRDISLIAGAGAAVGDVTLTSGGTQSNPLGAFDLTARNFTLTGTLWVEHYKIGALGNVALSDHTLRAVEAGTTNSINAGGNVSGATISNGSAQVVAGGDVSANVTAQGDASVSGNNVSGSIAGSNVVVAAKGTVNASVNAANTASVSGNAVSGSISASTATVNAGSSVQVTLNTGAAVVHSGGSATVSGSSSSITVDAQSGSVSGSFGSVGGSIGSVSGSIGQVGTSLAANVDNSRLVPSESTLGFNYLAAGEGNTPVAQRVSVAGNDLNAFPPTGAGRVTARSSPDEAGDFVDRGEAVEIDLTPGNGRGRK